MLRKYRFETQPCSAAADASSDSPERMAGATLPGDDARARTYRESGQQTQPYFGKPMRVELFVAQTRGRTTRQLGRPPNTPLDGRDRHERAVGQTPQHGLPEPAEFGELVRLRPNRRSSSRSARQEHVRPTERRSAGQILAPLQFLELLLNSQAPR